MIDVGFVPMEEKKIIFGLSLVFGHEAGEKLKQ